MQKIYAIFSNLVFFRRSFIVALFALALVTIPSNLHAEFDYDNTQFISNGTAENGTDPWVNSVRLAYEHEYSCGPFGWWTCTELDPNPSNGGDWYFKESGGESYLDIDISNNELINDIESHGVIYQLDGQGGRKEDDRNAKTEIKVIFLDALERTIVSNTTGLTGYDGGSFLFWSSDDNDMQSFVRNGAGGATGLSGNVPAGTKKIRVVLHTVGDAAIDNVSLKLAFNAIPCSRLKDDAWNEGGTSYTNNWIPEKLWHFDDGDATTEDTGDLHETTESVRTCIDGQSKIRRFFIFSFSDKDYYKFNIKADGILKVHTTVPLLRERDSYNLRIGKHKRGRDYYGRLFQRASIEHEVDDILIQQTPHFHFFSPPTYEYDPIHVRVSGHRRWFTDDTLDEYRLIFDFKKADGGIQDLCTNGTRVKCRGLFGFGFFPFRCNQSTVIKRHPSHTDGTLTQVSTYKYMRSFFNSSRNCGIYKVNADSTIPEPSSRWSRDNELNRSLFECKNISGYGLFGNFLNPGVQFDMPDYGSDTIYAPYTYKFFPFFRPFKWKAKYFKGEGLYMGNLDECPGAINSGGAFGGPFDAWDIWRDVSDRNISTKIVGKKFKLQIAHLDDELNVEDEDIPAGAIHYALYSEMADSFNPILNSLGTPVLNGLFPQNGDPFTTPFITIDKAYKSVFVGFKVCAVYNRGENTYSLEAPEVCENNTVDIPGEGTHAIVDLCSDQTPDINATWHICASSDQFSVRPAKFTVDIPGETSPYLLTSGKELKVKIVAKSYNNTPSAVSGYNQTSDGLSIAKKLYLKTGALAASDEMNGTLEFADGNFSFSTTTNTTSADVNISFNDVGKVSLAIYDNDWTAVDAYDDSYDDCRIIEDLNQLESRRTCSQETNATFIPAVFGLSDVNVTDNNKSKNLTYLSSDLNMSAHVTAKIVALNAAGDVTLNFKEGNNYYENPVSLNLTIPDTATLGIPSVFNPNVHNIETQSLRFTEGQRSLTLSDSASSAVTL